MAKIVTQNSSNTKIALSYVQNKLFNFISTPKQAILMLSED